MWTITALMRRFGTCKYYIQGKRRSGAPRIHWLDSVSAMASMRLQYLETHPVPPPNYVLQQPYFTTPTRDLIDTHLGNTHQRSCIPLGVFKAAGDRQVWRRLLL